MTSVPLGDLHPFKEWATRSNSRIASATSNASFASSSSVPTDARLDNFRQVPRQSNTEVGSNEQMDNLGERHPRSYSPAESLHVLDDSRNALYTQSRQQDREDDEVTLLQGHSTSPQPGEGSLCSKKIPSTSQSSPPPYGGPYFSKPPANRRSRCCGWPGTLSMSWNMYIFFAFGLACAIAHHAFYASLDGKPATDQLQMLRYGTFLAFAAKAGLSAAVVVAFRQRVWTTVRRRTMTVGALDSLFAATEDLIALVNWELAKSAKVALALAVFVWVAPLVVILTSNTLLVVPRTAEIKTTCPSVRSLNFTFEETNEWRDPVKIDQLFEIPVSLWNTTKRSGSNPDGWFDYYTAPSPSFQRTAAIGAFLDQAVMRKNAQIETCGSGWNCSFEVQFTAPGYKCTELASGVGSKPVNLTQESGTIAPPFDTDLLIPTGPYTYYAFTSGGEYSTTQMDDVGIGGVPKTDPPYPKNLGAFRTEPIIWIGYSVLVDPAPDKPVPINSSDPSWASSIIPKLFACENYESAYTVRFNYSDAAQSTTVTNITFLRPVINTTYIPSIDANDGTADNVTAVPESNYIRPIDDLRRYRRTAAYHSLGYMLRSFINGTVEMDQSLVNPIANTDAIQTKLLDPRNNYFAYPNLPELLQSFYEDIILSMLSNPQFVDVVWAARPAEQSGTRLEGGTGPGQSKSDYLYPCVKSHTANTYHYNVRDLWIVYCIAILFGLVGIVTGACAILENDGAVRDTRFSSIVAATRGPALEKIKWDGNAGSRDDVAHMADDVKQLRVGYGLVPSYSGRSGHGVEDGGATAAGIGGLGTPWKLGQTRYGFGLEGDVQPLEKLRKRESFMGLGMASGRV